MTQPKKDRSGFKKADPFADRHKPAKPSLNLIRTCLGLGCGTNFIAETKYIRLCEYCRKKDHQ